MQILSTTAERKTSKNNNTFRNLFIFRKHSLWGNQHPARWPILLCGSTQEPVLATANTVKTLERFWKKCIKTKNKQNQTKRRKKKKKKKKKKKLELKMLKHISHTVSKIKLMGGKLKKCLSRAEAIVKRENVWIISLTYCPRQCITKGSYTLCSPCTS